MKNKIIGIFVCMLAIISTIVLPVAGNENLNTTILEKHSLDKPKQGSTTYEDNWWPMFRHDSGNSGCTLSIAPSSNMLNWKQTIDQEIFSTAPVVYDDKLYISTGWYYDFIGQPPNMTKGYPFEKPSLSNIIENLTTYNEEYLGGVYCLDADTGAQLWDYEMYAPNDPAVVDGKVYVTDLNVYSYSSSLYCLDAETGDKIWQKSLNCLVLSPTIVAGDKIYLGCLDLYSYSGSVKCININGDQVWNYPLPTYEFMWFSAPAVYEGNVYFISTDLYNYYYGNLYCLNAATGEKKWSKNIFSWWFFSAPSPVCADGNVFAVDLDLYSYISQLKCFDAETGNIEWVYNLGPVLSFSTPAVCTDGVFFTGLDIYSYNNWLYRVHPKNGTLMWKTPIPGDIWLFSSSSPVCSEYKVFVCPNEYYFYSNELYCLDKEDGSILWDYELDYVTLASLSIADERVYIADYMGNVYAFEDVLKIGAISGGLLSVKTVIKNIGVSDFTDVSWTISVNGGLFGMINQEGEGTISSLPGGTDKPVRAFPVLGFGKVEIEVTATMSGLNIIKKNAEGLVLGPFVIVLS